MSLEKVKSGTSTLSSSHVSQNGTFEMVVPVSDIKQRFKDLNTNSSTTFDSFCLVVGFFY